MVSTPPSRITSYNVCYTKLLRWIISNWLTSVLLVEKDQGTRASQISKAMRCLDNFINIYPPDGGCDEGPGYWGHAGGALFYCLDILKSASDGAINLFEEPLIKNIGGYIYKAHIAGDYFVNFADASAKIGIDARITSYNVCYTKLLRAQISSLPGPNRAPISPA